LEVWRDGPAKSLDVQGEQPTAGRKKENQKSSLRDEHSKYHKTIFGI
jgi:hypothetical protein